MLEFFRNVSNPVSLNDSEVNKCEITCHNSVLGFLPDAHVHFDICNHDPKRGEESLILVILSLQGNSVALAQSVLAELPDQVSSFFNSYNLKPPNIITASNMS